MAKFASFDFSGLSSKAREAVNKSSFTRGKKGADGIPMIVVSIAGATLGPFHGLQEAADETKKWAKKKFPGKVAADSINAIAAKYGFEVKQNDSPESTAETIKGFARIVAFDFNAVVAEVKKGTIEEDSALQWAQKMSDLAKNCGKIKRKKIK